MGIVSTGKDSAELSNASSTFVPAECNIRLLRDQIIVEPMLVEHSKLFDVIEHTKPLRGIVKAAGPGHYPKRYDHPDKHKRTRMWVSKAFQPIDVKVGDLVELGGYGVDDRGGLHLGFNFQTFYWGNKLHVICREADVAAIVENEDETERTEPNQESIAA